MRQKRIKTEEQKLAISIREETDRKRVLVPNPKGYKHESDAITQNVSADVYNMTPYMKEYYDIKEGRKGTKFREEHDKDRSKTAEEINKVIHETI
jgi:hypothetical protein